MKVGDLVRKKVSSNAPVPSDCFGIVVQVFSSSVDESSVLGGWARVDFGDYGVFWRIQSQLELLS